MSSHDAKRRRRGHGEGSISQRADGRWLARVTVGYRSGKQVRKYLYGATRREVADKLKVLLHQQGQGVNVAPERQKLSAFLDHWLATVVRPKTRPGTYTKYEQIVRNYIAPALGHIALTKLTAQHVESMLAELQRRPKERQPDRVLSASTVQRVRDVLRNALNQAVEWELVPRNVALRAKGPKVEQYEPRTLTPLEAQQLLTAAAGDRLEALYRVALSLGLREGEALGLRWKDVDLGRSALSIRVALQRVKRGRTRTIKGKEVDVADLVLTSLKTQRSQRTIPLAPSLVSALREHKARQLSEQMMAGSRWQDHGLVFTTTIGTPINPRNMVRSFDALLTAAGLPHMRFHDLRHSCATLFAAQGVPARVAMEILGHTNISTTMNIYTHVLDESKRQAMAAMDTVLEAKNEAI